MADPRWVYVREWPVLNTRLGWTAFNLLFISFYQNFLLLSLALPALYSALSPASLGLLDLLISVTFLLLVLVETLADNQQEDFQNEKHRQLRSQKTADYPYSLGFVNWGLFAISRHPNYLAEQLLWVVFYLYTIPATGDLVNITIIGPVLLILLFQGSTLLSESITGGKYPKYSQYRATVPRFIGNFWTSRQSYPCLLSD